MLCDYLGERLRRVRWKPQGELQSLSAQMHCKPGCMYESLTQKANACCVAREQSSRSDRGEGAVLGLLLALTLTLRSLPTIDKTY